ncbi:hypothetical protein V8C44DRAFT_310477 [Trichoderma aethiopicum]
MRMRVIYEMRYGASLPVFAERHCHSALLLLLHLRWNLLALVSILCHICVVYRVLFGDGMLLTDLLCLPLLVIRSNYGLAFGKGSTKGEQTGWEGCKREGNGVCECLFACCCLFTCGIGWLLVWLLVWLVEGGFAVFFSLLCLPVFPMCSMKVINVLSGISSVVSMQCYPQADRIRTMSSVAEVVCEKRWKQHETDPSQLMLVDNGPAGLSDPADDWMLFRVL